MPRRTAHRGGWLQADLGALSIFQGTAEHRRPISHCCHTAWSCCQHIFQCRHVTHDSRSRSQQRQRQHSPCTLAKPEPQLQHRAATAKLLHEALPTTVPCFSALV